MGKSDYLERSRAYKGFHYTALAPASMEYLHKRTLEMLRHVVSVLDRNGIHYMVCGGTLLGAATGGRFIPWDDDVDLCVPEEEYARAMECLAAGLGEGMALQSPETDERYYLGWNKVRDRHSHVYPDAPAFRENGVWIDIYKLRHARKNSVPYLVAKENIDYLNRRLIGGV